MIFEFSYQGKDYEFDDERMGLGEARWVKRETGLVGSEFFLAARKLDPDAVIAVLGMAMRRSGSDVKYEDLYADDDNGYYNLIESMTVRPSPAAKPVEPPKIEPKVRKTRVVKE